MIQKIQFKAMGCHMMAALNNPSIKALQKLQQVPAWFEDWEQTFSRFRENGELSRLNRSPGYPFTVSPEFWDVFQIALAGEKRSQGLVSPAILESLVIAGYESSFDKMPSEQSIAGHTGGGTLVTIAAIRWDADTRKIVLPPGLRLDFGGIVKGWAADQALRRLKNYGAALVDAGGDIAISGLQSDGQPWPIGVSDPFNPQNHFVMLQLGHGGVATSGIDYRRWKQNDRWMHHIIDPRTGNPAETDILSTTIVAPSVIDAEIAAKVVLISGSQEGLAWLEAHQPLAGILVLNNGERLYSRRMDHWIWR
jgi:thiamine biosynthesis lipoprotein